MAYSINRRAFLLGSAAAATAALAPWPLRHAFAAPATTLTIARRSIVVKGRAASVFGIAQPDGKSGITLEPGSPFRIDLVNDSGEKTLIHWHGQKPPYLQDGFPDKNRPLIRVGATQSYDYSPTPGTHWMHSHQGVQEQALMTAPLVVRSAEDARADVQEVIVILNDFSFRPPEEILAGLTGGAAKGMAGMDMGGKSGMAGMDPSAMKMGTPAAPAADTGMKMDAQKAPGADAGMKMDAAPGGGMKMGGKLDLNDVDYDAFLANDRTLDDPLVVQVDRGGRVRLRLINAGASTAFWIDLGALSGTLITVDGNPVTPVSGTRFPMAIAQRLDLMIDVPTGGAFPIFAQVEGMRDRTGVVLAAPGARIEKVAGLAEAESAPLDLALEAALRATSPLAERSADIVVPMALTGSMENYVWSINDKTWPNVDRPVIRKGQRVVIEMQNRTMMAHPMHLHGHAFQVIGIDGADFKGALRDTVLVPASATVRVAFDADNPGRWPLHCHNLYHMETGMMTEVVYDNYV